MPSGGQHTVCAKGDISSPLPLIFVPHQFALTSYWPNQPL